MQARAAATLEGNPVEVGVSLGIGDGLGGGGVGSTGSGITILRGTLRPVVKATPRRLFAFGGRKQPIRLMSVALGNQRNRIMTPIIVETGHQSYEVLVGARLLER